MPKKKIPFYQRMRLFQKAVLAISASFGIAMVVVTIIAFTRPSHHTQQDVEKMQHLRHPKNKHLSSRDQ